VVAHPIANQTTLAGVPFSFRIPGDTWTDVVTADASIWVRLGGSGIRFSGAADGLSLTEGVQGVAEVSGTSSGGGLAWVEVVGVDGAGGNSSVVEFVVELVDSSPNISSPLGDQGMSAGGSGAAVCGEWYNLTVPVGWCTDLVTASGSLSVSGSVSSVSGSVSGLSVSSGGSPGSSWVSGDVSCVGGGRVEVTLVCRDEVGGEATEVFELAVIDAAPFVVSAVPDQTGQSGTLRALRDEPFGPLLIPSGTFGDVVTPAAELALSANTTIVSATGPGNDVGELSGLWLNGTRQGSAWLVGTPLCDCTIRVDVAATDGGGSSVVMSFVILSSDRGPLLARPIPDQSFLAGVPFVYTIPGDTFLDASTAASAILLSGEVLPDLGSVSGVSFVGGAQGRANVTGTSPGAGRALVFVTAMDDAGLNTTANFTLWLEESAPFLVGNVSGVPEGVYNESYAFVLPGSVFDDHVTAASALVLSGRVSGAVGGLVVDSGVAGVASVRGVPNEIGDALVEVNATDEAGLWASTAFTVHVVERPPYVRHPVADLHDARAGVSYSWVVPAGTFGDDYTAVSSLMVRGSVAFSGGASGLVFSAGAPGTASLSGVSPAAGSATVTLTVYDSSNLTATDVFEVAVIDEPPVVAHPIANQTTLAGVPFSFRIPGDTWTDVVTADASIWVRLGGSGIRFSGAADGLSLTEGVQGVAEVSGTSSGGGLAWVEVVGVDGAGGNSSVVEFVVELVDSSPNISSPLGDQGMSAGGSGAAVCGEWYNLTVPVGWCTDLVTASGSLSVSGSVSSVSGSVSGLSVSSGGSPGSSWVSGDVSCVGGGRVEVTLVCRDEVGGEATEVFELAVIDAAPFVVSAVPDQNAVAGEEYTFVIPSGTFEDVVTPAEKLQVTGSLAHSNGTSGLTLVPGLQGNASVVGLPTKGGVASVNVTCTDSVGGSVALSFRIVIVDEPPFVTAVGRALSPPTATSGRSYSYDIPANSFGDTVTGALVHSASSSVVAGTVTGLAFVSGSAGSSSSIRGTPSGSGRIVFNVTASDEASGSVTLPLSILVALPPAVVKTMPNLGLTDTNGDGSVDGAPVVSGRTYSWIIGADLFEDPSSLMVSNATIEYSGSLTGFSFVPGRPGEARLEGVPSGVGTARVTLMVYDSQGAVTTMTFEVTVSDPSVLDDNKATTGQLILYAGIGVAIGVVVGVVAVLVLLHFFFWKAASVAPIAAAGAAKSRPAGARTSHAETGAHGVEEKPARPHGGGGKARKEEGWARQVELTNR